MPDNYKVPFATPNMSYMIQTKIMKNLKNIKINKWINKWIIKRVRNSIYWYNAYNINNIAFQAPHKV